jgi:D-lactate dehydrogenase
VSAQVVVALHRVGVRYIAIRAAGYDNVDVLRAADLNVKCANVPAYSPYAVAEHAVALMLALNRKIVTAAKQVSAFNFTVGNLIGFDMKGKTVGIIGIGKIGSIVARICHGFGCKLLGYDLKPDLNLTADTGIVYTRLEELCAQADIISLHVPLNESTHYLVADKLLAIMKQGVMLINTARGPILNTNDVISYLESGKIGALGLDVYEKERGLFFYDHSHDGTKDPLLKKLLSFPNVLITPHQGFATHEALQNIAESTFYNLHCWASGKATENELKPR